MVDQYGRWQLYASSCGQDHIPRWLWLINMAGGNSSPQVVDRTIYQDGYGGSIWPVATLRLKLWTAPYIKMLMVDQYGRWQLHASSCKQDHRQRWIWWMNMTLHLKLLTGLDTMVDMVAYDKQSCSDIEDFPVLLVEDAT